MKKESLINVGQGAFNAQKCVPNCNSSMFEVGGEISAFKAYDTLMDHLSKSNPGMDSSRAQYSVAQYFASISVGLSIASGARVEDVMTKLIANQRIPLMDFARDFFGMTMPAVVSATINAGFVVNFSEWRYSKNVFSFDPSVQESMTSAAKDKDFLNQKIPLSVLSRMPCKVVCVPVKLDVASGGLEKGAILYAFVSCEVLDDKITFSYYMGNEEILTNVWYQCGFEGRDTTFGEMIDSSPAFFIDTRGSFDAERKDSQQIEAHKELALTLIQMCLFLCSEDPDYSTQPSPDSVPKKTKRGTKRFHAEKVNVVDVGVRIGKTIRQAYQDSGYHGHGTDGSSTGHKVRPHFRRAHWHTFRIGKRLKEDGTPIPAEKREARIKWVPPVVVNASSGDVDVVVREVLQ